jgi:fructose-1,6-bisphosphatase/inositol monophosphatase family enzyme
MINKLLEMIKQAGKIALDLIHDSQPTLKPDQSVLTRADREVSQYLRRAIDEAMRGQSYLILDEEDGNNPEFFNEGRLNEAKYLWLIDPIDGTRAYSNRIPLFGISIGVLKDRAPWLGAVFFPALNELFFCDGEQSFFVEHPFCEKEKRTLITPVDQEITPQTIFLASDRFIELYEWDRCLCQIMMPTTAVTELCWPAIGRACGSYFQANAWDFGGSWPIFHSAGLAMRSFPDGKVLERLDLQVFIGSKEKSWYLKSPYILSSARNFQLLKERVRTKNKLSWLTKLRRVG